MSKDQLGRYSKEGRSFLYDLRDQVAHQLKDINIDPDIARQFANELMFTMSQNWGGQSLYIIKDDTFHIDERDIKIYNDFNGHNHTELAKKYKLSLQYIYRIIKRMAEIEKKRNQPDLFE